MTEPRRDHRLDGLEPDNLLAFLALLGLLIALEHARPAWRPRVRWSWEDPPIRPVLMLREAVTVLDVAGAAAAAVTELAKAYDFEGRVDLNYPVADARALLHANRVKGGHAAALHAALLSDAAVKVQQEKRLDQVEATPLCLLFGQGHQHFLNRLASVPRLEAPPPRGRGRKAVQITAADCLAEALFSVWDRPDPTQSFRWDPAEGVRYALMFGDPSDASNKQGTQHGANRLAAIGLSAFPVAPVTRNGEVRLDLPGGAWPGGFALSWPLWEGGASLSAIQALLLHPGLPDGSIGALGVVQVRQSKRFSLGKFMNFSEGRTLLPPANAAP
jgi:hypothetical protein